MFKINFVELFYQTDADKAMVKDGIGVDVSLLKTKYYNKIAAVLDLNS